ncbi:undecaprenyl-diphosphate phosphatase [Weissella muntiaci]|uniref:Undecaprenyl-diphosphatase n=1 Tax=Weissella muntiaci TaxID=2508881 RepID=A0A6C2C3M1_9LACO|nr:undecaprenyl-diphosphate phosphatase [Weissella muntiaci]TYC48528.1 undecaprenyl-diphosphate phosphatase [Weissella muntiaci]
MIEFIQSLIIGIVEGITEFLPVSSTGHIIIAESLMGLPAGAVWTKAFVNMFDYVIQLGAIMAVIQLYFTKLNPFASKKSYRERVATWRLWFKVIIGVLPAVVFGFLLNDWMDAHLMNPWVVAGTLIFYGILFILLETRNERVEPWLSDLDKMSWKMALAIGMFQVLSIVPGTSRSGATILGAMFLGTSRFVAAEFSFFMSIPVMFGVSILKVGKYVADGGVFTGAQTFVMIVGFVVSWIVAFFAIKFMMRYIQNHDFKIFGWYRIVVGILVILMGMFGLLKL